MADDNNMNLAHNVYFNLSDASPAAQQKLIDASYKYLKGHPGEVYFSVGTLVPDLARPVNDRGFHVGLHVVFENRAAHDAYQAHPRHIQFINENKPNWASVRVFDSYVR
ncbi:MAG: Dabb family protein [Planctomycetia bacterium]|nr:Dabb family protein [Planctomycetia bacterium]